MNILFRSDASSDIGTGHVMRCLALAEGCVDSGGKAAFAMSQTTEAIEQRLRSERVDVIRIAANQLVDDARETVEAARRFSADWVVLDGYQFGPEHQRSLQSPDFKVLLIDDLGKAQQFAGDLILNQNVHATEEMYTSREDSTGLLLGPSFALMRHEFRAWRNWNRSIPERAGKILITMGGSDPAQVTAVAMAAFASLRSPETEAIVLVGGSNRNLSTIRQVAESAPNLRVYHDQKDVAELIAWADVAISAAGSTCYEFCLLGLPAIVVDVSENQKPIATELARLGVVRHLGSADQITLDSIAFALKTLLGSPEQRTRMSLLGKQLVDGRGVDRVLHAIRSRSMKLQKVNDQDCRALWTLANDPETRKNSFNSDRIPWEEHQSWFSRQMRDPKSAIFLAWNGQSSPIGMLRYQKEADRATVSLSVACEYRGQGYGNALLSRGMEEIFRDASVRVVDAYVKPGNQASISLFTRAGFTRRSDSDDQRSHLSFERILK
jgi:UDP-2,4-diacetamido-2,4,6-trideoxy-beta-L-altropyranose hydrolase